MKLPITSCSQVCSKHSVLKILLVAGRPGLLDGAINYGLGLNFSTSSAHFHSIFTLGGRPLSKITPYHRNSLPKVEFFHILALLNITRQSSFVEMTNKRARREATGPSQEGTSRSARVQRHPPQGMSEGALAWMATPRQHTNCQPERGMQLVPVEYPEIWNALLGHHWEGFVKDRQRFDPQLVKEFYACWCDIRDNGRVPIRGKLVEFTPARINRFYEIPEPTPDIEILRLDDGTPITQEEASVLAHPGFILNFEADFIPYTELVLEARIWTHFIQHSMTPSTSYKRLYRNRAKIVHAIMIGKYIDVGSVIVDEFKTVRGDHKSGLAFPCLITALCTAAGVPTASRAALEKPKGPMTRVTTAAIRRTMGAEAEAARLDREAGQEPANEDDEELEGHPEQAQQPVQQIEAGHIFSWDQMREYMDSQFRDLRRDMNKGFDALDGRMKSLEERFPPRSPRGPQ